MSSHNGTTTHSEQAKMEQIITEFFAKSLHIILESRTHCPYFSGEQGLSSPSSLSPSSSSVRSKDKWFNLALQECPAAIESLGVWRQNNLEPIVIDVVLAQKPLDCDPMSFSPQKGLVRNLSLEERYSNCWGSDKEDFGFEAKREKIIERWVVQYERRKGKDCYCSTCSSNGNRRSSNNLLHVLYKRSILLLRSLYATMRILPAYKIFRDLNSCNQFQPFMLAHRVSSFVEPFTRREEAEMQCFRFNPVDTSCGRLCLSVLYRASVSEMISEPLTPMSPNLIQDYVGSPLADPFKRLPSLPVSRGSPSSLPFSRRHSLSFDDYREDKLSAIGKEEAKKSSAPKISSNNSSHISISRSSSRSFPDDFNEPDFACAFDVECDITDPSIRPESFDLKGNLFKPLEPGEFFPVRKSQDAAVGALVHMLKNAPPLRQDISRSMNTSQGSARPEICIHSVHDPNKVSKAVHQNADSPSNVISSGFGVWKTTADALEELRSYRDAKALLLQHSHKSNTSVQ